MRLFLPRPIIRYGFLVTLALLIWQARGLAQDAVVPAGTIIHCTLDEPNFSSATASVGDPVVCHLNTLQEFGRTAFPRGSYLEGHLEADKEPGHFFGKGYLRLVFDRIGLPNTDVPVPSKVIATRGYRVNKDGDIVGHGHAIRDTVEWMLPPLWPWKVIMLPARGPRPTLKGEQQITLRLMDDIIVPRMTLGPGWHFFGESTRRSSENMPQTGQPNTPAEYAAPARFETTAPSETPTVPDQRRMTLIALRTGGIYEVASYRVDNGRLNYVLDTGETGSAMIADVDWTKTSQLNEARSAGGGLQAGLRTY